MTIMISWSGARSRTVATILRAYLAFDSARTRVWMSNIDIDAGARWSRAVAAALESAQVGILCLTAESLRSPWVLFEAGALSKTVDDARVLPYLIGMHSRNMDGPLGQFQCLKANHQGTLRLFREIAKLGGVDQSVALEAAAACWPSLANSIYWHEQEVFGKPIHRLTMRVPRGPNQPDDYPGWLLPMKAGGYRFEFEFPDALWESQIVIFTTRLEAWADFGGGRRVWTRVGGCRSHSDARTVRVDLTETVAVFVIGAYKPGPPNPRLEWECSDPLGVVEEFARTTEPGAAGQNEPPSRSEGRAGPVRAFEASSAIGISFEDGSGANSFLRISSTSSQSIAECIDDTRLL